MKRKAFIKHSLFATGAVALPNVIWALSGHKDISANATNKFISVPNLNRFKVSDNGTKFFEAELSILKSILKLSLNRKYFISESTEGNATPTLLENKKETFVFIPELYQDKRHNGFIVKLCADGLCEETKIFTHENQGFYAFWGKEYLQQPTLYHYNFETLHLMRIHRENEQWINHRVMPMYPSEMVALYNQQLQQVSEGQLQQQFGYDFEIRKDGVYQFLHFKHEWEESLITKRKEAYEEVNPAMVYSSVSEITSVNIGNTLIADGYSYPFMTIYCKGDDVSNAYIKPTIIYEEVPGSKIEIPDMPAYQTQDDIGDCKAFSLAAILQWYTCHKWKTDIPDCKNPPADSDISYLGLMMYTNQKPNHPGTFEPKQGSGRTMSDIINDLSKDGNRLILSSCKSSDILVKNFLSNSARRDNFFKRLKISFDEQNVSENDLAAQVKYINEESGLAISEHILKKAFEKTTFDEFLYIVFFDGCEKYNFPSGFRAAPFPLDEMDVTPDECKTQVLKGLKLGKPVLLPALCMSQNKDGVCNSFHSIVVSGFKKVGHRSVIRDVFKVHNSWGAEWQQKSNDGWVDADILMQNISKSKSPSGYYRIDSSSVIWLDP